MGCISTFILQLTVDLTEVTKLEMSPFFGGGLSDSFSAKYSLSDVRTARDKKGVGGGRPREGN